MTISDHADHTEKLYGIRGEDIHKWIDGLFDVEGFSQFLKNGRTADYNPYEHRRHRHCREALEEAYGEFKGKYSPEQIKNVFETHIKDDYDGIIPFRADFSDDHFTEKYHEQEIVQKESILSDTELKEYFKGHAYRDFEKSAKIKISGFQLRIITPALVTMVLFLFTLFFLIVPLFRNVMMEGKKEMEKELSAAAASIIYYYIDLEKQNLLTREEAQGRAITEIEKMRYGPANKDYFWITDMHPRMIMHPYHPELINQDLTHYTDSEDKSGIKLFVEFVNLVKEHNDGYLEYLWQWMDDTGKAVPKLSYVVGIPYWGWILGTGVYIQDIQEETERFTKDLFFIISVISGTLFLLLLYLVTHSRKTENQRKKAETGLREAKERYRALVEASNEGYILEMDGEIVYSNLALQRMLDYSEEDFASLSLLSLLADNQQVNNFAQDHLAKLMNDQVHSASFEAQIQTKTGQIVDMIVNTSRIFFSERNGHLISFRKITSVKNSDIHTPEFISGEYPNSAPALADEIRGSHTVGHIILLLNHVPVLIRNLTEQGTLPAVLRKTIGSIYDSAVGRFIELALREIDEPPVPFAFLNLGSNARHEMTFFSDQDNALVFASVPESERNRIRRYFLRLSEKVSSMLHQGGFSYCPGGIMASNPRWCLSVDEWRDRISTWVTDKNPESLLKINVFADIRRAYGDSTLSEFIQDALFEAAEKNPAFFPLYARNCLSYRIPLTMLGHLKGERVDGVRSINIKQVIKILENFARLYAVKYRLPYPSTEQRIEKLLESHTLSEESAGEFIYIFNYLWHLRFSNQLRSHTNLRRVNDELEIGGLLDVEHKNLQNVMTRIQVYQSRISFDFLGTPL